MKVIWSSDAGVDQHRIWMFAAEHDVERADRNEARMETRVESLGALPRQGRPITHGRRQLSLPDIQIVVQYRIVEDEDAIRILRVWHTRENRESQ